MDQNQIAKTVENVVSNVLRPNDDITLFAAQHLAKKVRKEARSRGVKLVIAIANKGGNPVLVECDDDSYIASYDIAVNKAFTSVSLKMSTKELSKLAAPNGSLYGIQFTNKGKIVVFGGGETLTNKNGEIIGAIGVSGGTEEQDTSLAKFAKQTFEKGSY